MEDIKSKFLRKKNEATILLHPEYLNEAYIPEKLLFRDEEMTEITGHAADFLFHNIQKNIVIYGPPGVGKTVAVKLVSKTYNEIAAEEGINSKAIYISLKDLTYHKTLYTLARSIGLNVKRGISISELYSTITKYLSETDTRYLMVLDEIDKMSINVRYGDAPLDSLVYSLSRINEATGRIAVNLFLVTNNPRTVERLSAPSFSSLAPIFLYFREYDAIELQEILRDRIEMAFRPGAVSEGAIQLLAALIRKFSRDLRWAFLVLKASSATAENGVVTERSIWRAIEVVDRDNLRQTIRGLNIDDMLVLISLAKLAVEIQRGTRARSEITSSLLYREYEKVSQLIGWSPRTMKHILSYIPPKLESMGLVSREIISRGRFGRTQIFRMEEDPTTILSIATQTLSEMSYDVSELITYLRSEVGYAGR